MPGSDIGGVLQRARRRYRRLRLQDRPPLDQPHNVCGLFEAEDMVALAKARLWPLPPRVQRWLRAGSKPDEEQRFRQALLHYARDRRPEMRRLLAAVLWPGKAAHDDKA